MTHAKDKEDGMKRAILLATAAFLAMLILVPMAMVQGAAPGGATPSQTIPPAATTGFTGFAPSGPAPSGTTEFTKFAPSVGGPTPTTGGPAILLPAVALLLGSGILTYAVLRRR